MKTKNILAFIMVSLFAVTFRSSAFAADKKVNFSELTVVVADPVGKIEPWMVLGEFWTTSTQLEKIWEYTRVMQEEDLTLEVWMSDENNWEIRKVVPETEMEVRLTLEPWMTDRSYWK